jgi:hypothetical protein
MAKKSTATRQHSMPSRRPQTAKPSTAKTSSGVTLVRTIQPGEEPKANTAPKPDTATPAADSRASAPVRKPTAAKSAPAKPAITTPAVTRPRAPEISTRPKASAPRPQPSHQQSQPAAGSAAAKAQAVRIARARAVQRARSANLVTPEHYSYVIRDLKLIAVLASLMVLTLIVLHFTLPA